MLSVGVGGAEPLASRTVEYFRDLYNQGNKISHGGVPLQKQCSGWSKRERLTFGGKLFKSQWGIRHGIQSPRSRQTYRAHYRTSSAPQSYCTTSFMTEQHTLRSVQSSPTHRGTPPPSGAKSVSISKQYHPKPGRKEKG